MEQAIHSDRSGLKIYYGFDEDNLFGGLDWQDVMYDIQQCKEKFEVLCRSALVDAFPDCQIEISGSLTTTTFDGSTDVDEVFIIEQICQDVYESYEWVSVQRILTIPEACDEYELPDVLITWACEDELITDATYGNSEWRFPEASFRNFIEKVLFLQGHDIYLIGSNTVGTGFDKYTEITENYEFTAQLNTFHLFMIGINLPKLPRMLMPSAKYYAVITSFADYIETRFNYVVPTERSLLNWPHGAFCGEIVTQASQNKHIVARSFDGKSIRFDFRYVAEGQWSLHELLTFCIECLNELVIESENNLAGGFYWQQEYEHNEDLFCRKVLAPLLKYMGFLQVRYTHGPTEFGKDFTFSEMNPFGIYRHYALQAKAGDIRGNVHSEIQEIVNQLHLAFGMPYKELNDLNTIRYISTFVVAISGEFKGNAKSIIFNMIPDDRKGAVHFLDKEAILELIGKHWPR